MLVVVSGRSGVTVGAEKAFQLARKNGKATMVFVSKCDLENANYFKILEDMKIKFGSTICPCVVPAKLDDGTPVYINLFSQKAFKYEGGKQIQVDLPDIGHRFQGLPWCGYTLQTPRSYSLVAASAAGILSRYD